MLAARRVLMIPLTFALGAGAAIVGCYEGTATFGAYCESDADCGPGQSCERNICGTCGDGNVVPGEFCYGDADETVVGGLVRVLATVDIDSDGDLDVAAVSNDSCMGIGDCWRLRVLDNDGAGEFTVGGGTPTPGSIESVAIGDFNENGLPDAALAVDRAGFVIVALDIIESEVQTMQILVPGPDVHTIQIGDMDDDGHQDLLVAADALVGTDSLHVFFGDGSGEVSRSIAIDAGPNVRIASPIDLDGDGDRDLVVTNLGQDTLRVLHNSGDGSFEPVEMLDTQMTPSFVTVGHLDDDGSVDAVVANTNSDSISIFRGAGGSFKAAESLAVDSKPAFVRIADVNQDGAADIVVSNVGTDKVNVYLGRDGAFPDKLEIDVAAAPLWIEFADVDGDDLGDLLISAGANVSVIRSEF